MRGAVCMHGNGKGIVRRPGEELEVVECPCGLSHRYFMASDGATMGLHKTGISGAKPHSHKEMTELYFVIEGEGQIVLDGETHDVSVGTAILIPPGVVHHGIDDFTVVVVYDKPELHGKDIHH